MKKKSSTEGKLLKKLDDLNKTIEKNNLMELSELLGNTKKLIIKNFFSGISKGVGIGIGFSILTAIIIYFLKRIVRLNIPIIGEYISDIIDIVEKSK